MGDQGDAARQLDRAQKVIEYTLAVFIPVLLAIMLYSYVLYDSIFQPLFLATLFATVMLLYPAYRALRLHYLCWSKNTMPQRLVTGLVGTIYISAASVFGVSLMSTSKGLDPEQPLTFGVFGFFALVLIGIMAYNSKYKDRFEHMDIRFYRKMSERVLGEVKAYLTSRTEDHQIATKGRRTVINLPKSKVSITLASQPGNSTEVIIECNDPTSTELCEGLKKALDRET